jgi:hypothetical protein
MASTETIIDIIAVVGLWYSISGLIELILRHLDVKYRLYTYLGIALLTGLYLRYKHRLAEAL